MLNNTSFANIKGFNYQPSYGSSGIEIWNNFDIAKIEEEITRGKRYFPHINLLRLWLSFDAFIKNPKLFCYNFNQLIEVLGKNNLQAMPVLFNNWHSIPDFGGVSPEMIKYWNDDKRCYVFINYLDKITKPYAEDKRIRLWDLCNEPFNGGGHYEVFVPWLKRLADHCRNIGIVSPITVGVSPSITHLEAVHSFCDVLTPHCYYAHGVWVPDEIHFAKNLNNAVAFANKVGKPMFAGETGWGALDDNLRASYMEIELNMLTERDMGFCVHMLNHSLIGDGHRPEYGIVSEAGFMGCVEADGSLRYKHELINSF